MRTETLRRPAHSAVRVQGGFWGERLATIHNTTVWDVLDKFERDHGDGLMSNYEWVAQGKTGKHVGPPWYDGLICETIRGISDIIAHTYDAKLDAKIDEYAAKIQAAQDVNPDGYINTYGTLICPDNRWGQHGGSLLWQHELYNIGCLVEAGVHHHLATGKTNMLSCAIKAADCVCGAIGDGKRNVVPAHSLPEEAFIKLRNLLMEKPQLSTANPDKYLALVRFWMDHRGVHHDRASYPHYMGEYAQDHRPVLEQHEAVGHAVRAALCYTGLTALGIDDDPKYLEPAQKLWDNATQTKMHVSGGIGAHHNEERFGYQYELPNGAYLETCAGVALCFWAGEMHRALGDAKYIDVFERALYNNVLPGLSLDGKKYFYENPLISDGSIARWDWHACPCCPPMFLKLMGALPDFAWSTGADGVYLNLHMGSRFETEIKGTQLTIDQRDCQIPWQGANTVVIHLDEPTTFTLSVRVPEWAGETTFTIGGQTAIPRIERGYAKFEREWQDGDALTIAMQMPAVKIAAHPYVEAAAGRVALMRGPLLYCLEAMDNGGDVDPLLAEGALDVVRHEALNCPAIEGDTETGRFRAIPYWMWANREQGKMAVWLRQRGMGRQQFSARFSQSGLYAAHSTNATGQTADLTGWDGLLYRIYQ